MGGGLLLLAFNSFLVHSISMYVLNCAPGTKPKEFIMHLLTTNVGRHGERISIIFLFGCFLNTSLRMERGKL